MRGPGRSRPAAVAAVLVLVTGLALVAVTASSGRTETVTPVTTASATPLAPPAASRPYRQPDRATSGARAQSASAPSAIVLIVLGVLVLVLVLLAILLSFVVQRVRMRASIRRYRRTGPDRLGPAPGTPDPVALAAAVEAGLRDLEEGSPGEGVIACWVQLERAAEDAGAGRAAPETPSELAGRLIDTHGVTAGPLVRLAGLYREARYSTHPVPESARTRARSLLEEVRADLALATASIAVQPRRVRR
ncbi:MAG TPA: DUF4129 domain-containing protein [Mycobacteriales bacterium]